MESLTLNEKVDANDKIIYEKLLEAESEMNNTSKRYTINDVESSMNSIINNKPIN